MTLFCIRLLYSKHDVTRCETPGVTKRMGFTSLLCHFFSRHTIFNFFLIGLLNCFSVLTGAWGILFFDQFRAKEPDLTKVRKILAISTSKAVFMARTYLNLDSLFVNSNRNRKEVLATSTNSLTGTIGQK